MSDATNERKKLDPHVELELSFIFMNLVTFLWHFVVAIHVYGVGLGTKYGLEWRMALALQLAGSRLSTNAKAVNRKLPATLLHVSNSDLVLCMVYIFLGIYFHAVTLATGNEYSRWMAFSMYTASLRMTWAIVVVTFYRNLQILLDLPSYYALLAYVVIPLPEVMAYLDYADRV